MKNSLKNEVYDLIAVVVKYAIQAVILLWAFGALYSAFPALAAFAGLSYFDWLGIIFGFNVISENVSKFFRASFGKG